MNNKIDVTQTLEWEMLVRNYTDTGFSRKYAENLATIELEKVLA